MEQVPSDPAMFTIGPYRVLKSIGKGGMGEVFLAEDPRCLRRVALKRMREDLEGDPNIRAHFLFEAHLTGLMSHPAIIPIYDIVDEPGLTYYTMPYIEGTTLNQLISLALEREKEGQPPDERTSLSFLLYAFLNICQAAFYAHSKGVIHRDLKPSNIMICPNGEAVILDWGLGKIMKNDGQNVENKPVQEGKTIDQVTGTVPYLAPEQALGHRADFSTEVYSLGIILYEILALRHPFHRDTLKQYQNNLNREVLLDPARVAPQRGISPFLSSIALKCLSPDPQDRYPSSEALLIDLDNYLKKHTAWFKMGDFGTNHSFFWEISNSDHLLLNKLKTFSNCWNSDIPLLISKKSFANIVKITLKIKYSPQSTGIGFFLGIPNAEAYPLCQRGYCLWLASETTKNTKLFFYPTNEISIENLFLMPGEWHDIEIEKIDNTLNFYLDQKLQFTFVKHLPLHQTHFGMWLPDKECEIENGQIFIGGHSFNSDPLAAANALFAYQYFAEALIEYREVTRQYPFTLEGRKAAFRAGVALLEYQRTHKELIEVETCLEEFDKLSDPMSAPMVLLGHALVYRYTHDYAEEVRCFEKAYDRYLHHPLSDLWHNQLLSRLLEYSEFSEETLYRYLLLAMRYLPPHFLTPPICHLVNYIKKISEPLYFINDQRAAQWPTSLWRVSKSIRLAFWLAKPSSLVEVIDEQIKAPEQHLYSIANALCALLELGAYELVEQKLEALFEVMLDVQALANFEWIHEAALIHKKEHITLPQTLLSALPPIISKQSMRSIIHILYESLRQKQTDRLFENIDFIENNFTFSDEDKKTLTCCRIWALLLEEKWTEAENLLAGVNDSNNHFPPLSFGFLKGCWICATQGKEAALHDFSALLKINPLALGSLFGQFIKEELSPNRISQAFMWEKRQFYRQAALYYHCLRDEKTVVHFQNLETKEYYSPDLVE